MALWAGDLKNLKTFVFVGTAMSVGYNDSLTNCTVHEEDGPKKASKHLTAYTKSKALAEGIIRASIPDEKLLIVRPSAVFGDSRAWMPRSFDVSWALAALNVMRLCSVDPQIQFDLVSIDYVCKAIFKLLLAKRNYNVYHISAGERFSSTMGKMLDVYAQADRGKPDFCFVDREYLPKIVRWSKERAIKHTSPLRGYNEYLSYWTAFLGTDGNFRILLAGMKTYFQYIELNQVFDNSRLLQDTDVGEPEPAHEYFKRTVGFHLEGINVVDGARNP
jgi:hypothetical protein